MPKLKTHSGTKARVRLTRNGKVRVGSPNRNHFMSKKTGGRRRALAGLHTLVGSNTRMLKKKLGA